MFRSKWTADNIPNQSGRVAVITGANSGIGFGAAQVLAAKGARVVLAVRDLAKGNQARQQILATAPGAEVVVEALDLASLTSVRDFAGRILARQSRLDLMINNAGVMFPPLTRTAEGFELQFGVNHLGHFALSALLFNVVASTIDSRIVNVSSLAHRAGKLDFSDLNWQIRKYRATQAYADSKLANLLFTHELARRLDDGDYLTKATAAHPGYTATNLQINMPFHQLLNLLLGQKATRGALPTLRAALDPDAIDGDYFGPDGLLELGGYPVKVKTTDQARDSALAARLWELSEELTGIEFPVA